MKHGLTLLSCLVFLMAAFANEGLEESSSGNPEDRFRQASVAYEAKDPARALAMWKGLVEEGFDGFELWYNMGNAAWRIDESAEALLYWERAALHAPFDPDVNANLQLVRGTLIDRVSDAPRLQIWNHVDQLFLMVPRALPGGAGLLFLWLASIWILLGYFGRAPLSRRKQRLILWLLVVLSLSSFAFMTLRSWALSQQNPGILMADQAVVHSAPSEGSIALFDLHRGVRIWIQSHSVDAQGLDWIELKLADGRLGWSPAEVYVPIKSRRLP